MTLTWLMPYFKRVKCNLRGGKLGQIMNVLQMDSHRLNWILISKNAHYPSRQILTVQYFKSLLDLVHSCFSKLLIFRLLKIGFCQFLCRSSFIWLNRSLAPHIKVRSIVESDRAIFKSNVPSSASYITYIQFNSIHHHYVHCSTII